jgi:hypothetical protein
MPRFANIGTDKDGKPILRPFTPEEEARRDAEEAHFAAHKDDPSPKTKEERLQEQIDLLAVEIEKLKQPK